MLNNPIHISVKIKTVCGKNCKLVDIIKQTKWEKRKQKGKAIAASPASDKTSDDFVSHDNQPNYLPQKPEWFCGFS